jgi:NAD(P)-dependent dehydrogenase (short-subunit alcohol dehydrogenase family)
MADKSIILVTGGNTGLGFAAVKALYASVEPHIVLMGSRSLDKANAAMEKLRSEVAESKSEVVPVQIDIEDDASIQSLRKEVESQYGRLDVLVNNAGQ